MHDTPQMDTKTLMWHAGLPTRATWDRLVPDVQEKILMHLSVEQLANISCMNKSFRAAFKQRVAPIESALLSDGMAAYPASFLTAVAVVLHRYHRRMDLATGSRRIGLIDEVTVHGCGTITAGPGYGLCAPSKRRARNKGLHAVLTVAPRDRRDPFGPQDLVLHLSGAGGGGRRPSARLTLRSANPINAAAHCNEAALLEVLGPRRPYNSCVDPMLCLSMLYVVAHLAAEGKMCPNPLKAFPQTPGGPAVPLPLPFSSDVYPCYDLPRKPLPALPSSNHMNTRRAISRHLERREAGRACGVVEVEGWPIDVWGLSGEGVNKGVATVLKLAAGFQVRECCVLIHPLLVAFRAGREAETASRIGVF
jgi:hypothetical protein